MDEPSRQNSSQASLPAILIAAAVQGWALYALHRSITGNQWPATDPACLEGLYAVAMFFPLTIQLTADQIHRNAFWTLITVLSASFFYFGWHQGSAVVLSASEHSRGPDLYFPFAIEMGVLWLLVLPFIQCRLQAGAWSFKYASLFDAAWRNTLVLAEAVLFTGLLWALLGLWQMLFHMIGIEFFRELLQKPIFVYPVTALTFGIALHLIGSIDRLTAVVLDQLLNVLKWLALPAALILAQFSVALATRLPAIFNGGQRIIGAAWLLWLVAFVVLLWNAAFRDGTIERPYPRRIGQALRFALPLLVVIALTALYALVVRANHYGLTVERVWAFIVAGAALVYAIGYSTAACRGGPWLAGIARVNVIAALLLIGAIAAALSPLLSPYRLAADSQFARALQFPSSQELVDDGLYGYRKSPFRYLRFEAGQYGQRRLQELATVENIPDAPVIRQLAKAALTLDSEWMLEPDPNAEAKVAAVPIYPTGKSLDAELKKIFIGDLTSPGFRSDLFFKDKKSVGVYIDLNGDGVDEFLLLGEGVGTVYSRLDHWQIAGYFDGYPTSCSWQALLDYLGRGDFSVQTSSRKSLLIGGMEMPLNDRELKPKCPL